MPQSFESKSFNIGTLLGMYENRRVVLPRFQRGFSWETTQISTFWNDLFSFHVDRKGDRHVSYFLGPIVIQDSQTEIVLLDGQQRLATSTILLSAIRNIARGISESGFTAGADLARDIQRELIEKDSESTQYSLDLSEQDSVFFKSFIQKDPPSNINPILRSHKLIKAAYDYFLKQLGDKISSLKEKPEKLKFLKEIRDCLIKNLIVVAIIVQEEEDAYAIFETLNDRGLRLSVPDLLLNLLLRRTDQIDSVRSNWNMLLNNLGTRDIAQFLRHMWLSQYGDLKARGLFSELKQHIESKKIDSLEFSRICSEECEEYVSILEVDDNIPEDCRREVEGLVKYLRITSCFPLLLSGLKCLNEADFSKLVKSTTALVVRYDLMGNLNPNDLETSFYVAAREIRGHFATGDNSARCLQAAKAILAKINPADQIVEQNAKNLILNRKQATWLITAIARWEQSGTKEIGFDKVNLEHVFPTNAGSEWPNRKELEPFVEHIGNLTLMGKRLNRNARNLSFEAKKNDYYSKSEIEMTKALTGFKQWTPQEIKARAEEMTKKIIKIWPGP